MDEFFETLRKGFESDMFDMFQNLDLTLVQMRMLFMLAAHNETMTINEAAEHLRVSMATTGRTVDRLVQLDMVDRSEDPHDRRSKLVSLTTAGRELTDAHLADLRARMGAFSRALPADVADDLRCAMLAAIAAAPPPADAGQACEPNRVRTTS